MVAFQARTGPKNLGQVSPILFVIAILAVLVGAISSGSGGFGSNTSPERARILAAQIIQYGQAMHDSTARLAALNGCDFPSFKFDYSGRSGDENSGVTSYCNAYDLVGGRLEYSKVPRDALDDTQSAQWMFGEYVIGQPRGSQWPNPSFGKLVAFAPWIKRDVCEQIQRILTGSTSIPQTADSIAMRFVLNSAANAMSFNNTNLIEGCIQGNSAGGNYGVGYYQPTDSYHYFRMLHLR